MFSSTGVSPSVPALSQVLRLTTTLSDSLLVRQNQTERSHNPRYATPAGYHAYVVWPLPLSLATTHGIAVAFSSCGY